MGVRMICLWGIVDNPINMKKTHEASERSVKNTWVCVEEKEKELQEGRGCCSCAR